MQVHAGTLLLAAAVAAQTLTLPDWMRSSQRDLPPEVFPPQKSTPTAAPAPTPPSTYADEPFVYEQVRRRVRFENDGTGRRQTEVRVRIQSDVAVQAFGLLAFGYNSANERLEIDRVEVRKPSGEVITASTDNIQDLALPVAQEAPVYSDFRQRHVTVPSLRPGDTLLYRATVTTTTALVPGQFWFAHDFERQGIVLDESLTLDLPASRQVILKVRPGIDAAATQPGAADRIIRTWHSTHLARDAKSKEQTKASTPQMAIQLTTFRTWEEVASWYADLASGPARADVAVRSRDQRDDDRQ